MKSYYFFIFLFFVSFKFCFASNDIIISQVQVSGNSSTDEFIELYNPTPKDIDLFDYKIQKKSSSGASYNIVSSIPEKSIIKAFSYYLVAHENFSLKEIIKPDFVYTNYSLANNNSIVLYNSDNNIVDVVGFGDCSYFESSCLNNILSNQSFVRINDYNNYGIGYGYGYGNEILCDNFDTDNNILDFFILEKSSPRNSFFKNECKYLSLPVVKFDNNLLSNSSNSSNYLNVDLEKNNENMANDFKSIFIQDNLKNYNIDLNVEDNGSIEKDIMDFDLEEKIENIVLKNDTKNINSYEKNKLINIEDFQFLNIDENVSLYGIVSVLPGEISNKYFYLNGVQVYNSKGLFPKLSFGDRVFLSGIVSSNYGEKRIKISNVNDISIISKDNIVDVCDLYNIEDEVDFFIAKLVSVNGVLSRKKTNKVYILNEDIETEIYLTDNLKDLYKNLKIGDNISVVGVLNKRNDIYRIIPRNSNDIEFVDVDLDKNAEINAAFVYETDDNLYNNNEGNLKKISSKADLLLKENENSKNYVIKNNNENLSLLKYFIIVFILIFLFIIFVIMYKKRIFMRINIIIKLIFKKIFKSK